MYDYISITMRTLIYNLLITLTVNGTLAQSHEIEIQLKKYDQRELQTRDQLLKLISTYDLKRWVFTKKVIIESGFQVIPHSHPVLTLNTRHLKDDELLLATFIHEQLHWFVSDHPAKEEMLAQLRALYPNPRTEFPEGSGGEIDTYYHLVICYLEYRALQELLGELKAHQVLMFWQQDHYRWIYKTVQEDQRKLDALVKKYNLNP
jgi:hypothetical protein